MDQMDDTLSALLMRSAVSDKEIVYRGVAPDGVWTLVIEAPNASGVYYATFNALNHGWMGVPFGHDVPPDLLSVDWHLPDSVLALYLAGYCYLLFRWGPRRRRRREASRAGRAPAFTPEEIQWFCAKKPTRF